MASETESPHPPNVRRPKAKSSFVVPQSISFVASREPVLPPKFASLIEVLHLPVCHLDWGQGCWPFFQPLTTEALGGKPHYLGEDWAFSHRLLQIGISR